jgi:hypothetical protein
LKHKAPISFNPSLNSIFSNELIYAKASPHITSNSELHLTVLIISDNKPKEVTYFTPCGITISILSES